MTRDRMGTQASHVDKLRRVWPGYVDVWRSAGMRLEGSRVWVHEGGWTPFAFFANRLVTGTAGTVTNREARMLDRYLGVAVNGAITCALTGEGIEERRRELEPLRWTPTLRDALGRIDARLLEDVDVGSVPLEDASVDVCHSGGALEHLNADELRAFLRECRRIVRPGGLLSHVIDHRDHLHHADASWPFLAHLRWSPATYRALFGHPLLFHNRMLPADVTALLEAEGFGRVVVRRLILPSHTWVETASRTLDGRPGISRGRLHASFANASDVDLRTAAAHYVFRR